MNWTKKVKINKVFDTLYLLRRIVYSVLIRERFKSVGKKFRICPHAYIKGGQYISFGDNARILKNFRAEALDSFNGGKQIFTPKITVGNYFCCGENVHIGAINLISIGNYVLLGSRIYITDHQHGMISSKEKGIFPRERDLYSKGGVVIEDNVFIGDGVVIMPGVKIETGAIIGANSVVTHDIPANAVACGCPAHIIRKL